MNLSEFFPPVRFLFSYFVPVAILLVSMNQKEMLLKTKPPASVLFGIHRIDDRSLGCAVVNPARAPTKHSKGLESWRTLRQGSAGWLVLTAIHIIVMES